MINVPKIISWTGEDGPYQYIFTSDTVGVTFSNTSGTTTATTVQTIISYPDEATIDTAVITLTVTPACGTPSTYTVSVDNPCDDLTLSAVSYRKDGNDHVFTVNSASPNCTSTTFTWLYDTSIWTQVSMLPAAFSSTLRLQQATSLTPSQSAVVVTATDCNNCVKTSLYNFTLCRPTARTLVFNLYIKPDGTYTTEGKVIGDPENCVDFTPDWSTFSYSVPSGITITQNSNFITVAAASTLTAQTYNGTYTVEGTNGIESIPGEIIIHLHDEGRNGTMWAPDKLERLDCGVAQGDVVAIAITGLTLATGTTPNWNSFQLVTPPTPLGSVNATISFGLDGTPYIMYTVPVAFSADVIAWTMADQNNIYMSTVTYTVTTCVSAPTAVNDTATVACGSTTNINILNNDLGNGSPIDQGTVQITEGPTVGSYSLNTTTGVITYVAPAGVATTDTIKYKVKNTSGEWSNEATLTITIICAGTNKTVVVCD